ncbi:MAG TPA: MBL fold metallo-hydrolase [bacterium]|nr:MBL fold metallo-hydrolase [bacterium]
MQITWVGHACLLIETANVRCLTDPWLSDPIFGGAIRHEPPRVHRLEDLPAPDIVCITHCHFDHFHDETLRRIDRSTPIVIPWSPIRNIRAELKAIGFRDVRQLRAWKSCTFRDLKITAIPSVGVPEEIAYVIEGEGQAVFDAADCVFEPIAELVGKRYRLDIGFIPFCGWDHSGLMGLQPEKIWKPDYDSLAKACVDLGLRHVVPAASNAVWYPEELRWLNERVCPGKAVEFMETVERLGGGRTRPLAMNPGDRWLGGEDRVTSAGLGPQISPAADATSPDWKTWLNDPNLKILEPEELESAMNDFLKSRRNHLLRVLPLSPKIVLSMLTTRFELASFYEGRNLFFEIDFRRWNPVKLGAHKTSSQFGLVMDWKDLCALVQGAVDSQDLVISQRMKMYYLPKSEYFRRVFGLEFIFFTRSLARLARAA